MAIIFGGGELSSFTKFNAIETILTGSFAAPARCGIHVKKGGYIRTDTLGLASDLWLHFDLSINKVSTGLVPIIVGNNAGSVAFSITSEGKVRVGAAEIGIVPIMTPGRFTIDIHLRGGTNGLVEVYADSQVMFSATGNFALASLQSLVLSPCGVDLSTDTYTVYSQVIVANEVTIGSKLATLVLESVGANNSWTGTTSNAAADVNETILNEATYISAQNAGMLETWATSDLDSTASNVRAVIISALAKYSTVGPKNLDAIARVGAANYFTPMTTLGAGYTPTQAIFHTNPITNAQWTRNEVNSSEFGIRSKV